MIRNSKAVEILTKEKTSEMKVPPQSNISSARNVSTNLIGQ